MMINSVIGHEENIFMLSNVKIDNVYFDQSKVQKIGSMRI